MTTSETGIERNQDESPSGRFEARRRLIERKSSRAYLKAGLFLFLALIAGMIIGAGVTLLVVKSKVRAQMPKAEQIGRRLLGRLGETVELTADEKSGLEEIVMAHMTDVDAIRTDFFDAVREEFDKMNDRVDAILGPERSEKWEADKRSRYGRHYRAKEDRHHAASRRVNLPSASRQE